MLDFEPDVPKGTSRWRCQLLKASFPGILGLLHPLSPQRGRSLGKLLILIRAPEMIRKGRGLSAMGPDKNDSSRRWEHCQAVPSSPDHAENPTTVGLEPPAPLS